MWQNSPSSCRRRRRGTRTHRNASAPTLIAPARVTCDMREVKLGREVAGVIQKCLRSPPSPRSRRHDRRPPGRARMCPGSGAPRVQLVVASFLASLWSKLKSVFILVRRESCCHAAATRSEDDREQGGQPVDRRRASLRGHRRVARWLIISACADWVRSPLSPRNQKENLAGFRAGAVGNDSTTTLSGLGSDLNSFVQCVRQASIGATASWRPGSGAIGTRATSAPSTASDHR